MHICVYIYTHLELQQVKPWVCRLHKLPLKTHQAAPKMLSVSVVTIFSGRQGAATALDLYCPQYCVTSVTTAYLARESLGLGLEGWGRRCLGLWEVWHWGGGRFFCCGFGILEFIFGSVH